LAISANIIDGFNGKIYFETKENEGTDFFVEIPLMRFEEQIQASEKRVVLD
jgi:signal transduction histidine kinase